MSHGFKIGIDPAAFWRLTWWEYQQCCIGYNRGMEEAAERKAQEMCLHLNVWAKKGRELTPDDLLGRKPRNKIGSPEDMKRRAEEVKREYDASIVEGPY